MAKQTTLGSDEGDSEEHLGLQESDEKVLLIDTTTDSVYLCEPSSALTFSGELGDQWHEISEDDAKQYIRRTNRAMYDRVFRTASEASTEHSSVIDADTNVLNDFEFHIDSTGAALVPTAESSKLKLQTALSPIHESFQSEVPESPNANSQTNAESFDTTAIDPTCTIATSADNNGNTTEREAPTTLHASLEVELAKSLDASNDITDDRGPKSEWGLKKSLEIRQYIEEYLGATIERSSDCSCEDYDFNYVLILQRLPPAEAGYRHTPCGLPHCQYYEVGMAGGNYRMRLEPKENLDLAISPNHIYPYSKPIPMSRKVFCLPCMEYLFDEIDVPIGDHLLRTTAPTLATLTSVSLDGTIADKVNIRCLVLSTAEALLRSPPMTTEARTMNQPDVDASNTDSSTSVCHSSDLIMEPTEADTISQSSASATDTEKETDEIAADPKISTRILPESAALISYPSNSAEAIHLRELRQQDTEATLKALGQTAIRVASANMKLSTSNDIDEAPSLKIASPIGLGGFMERYKKQGLTKWDKVVWDREQGAILQGKDVLYTAGGGPESDLEDDDDNDQCDIMGSDEMTISSVANKEAADPSIQVLDTPPLPNKHGFTAINQLLDGTGDMEPCSLHTIAHYIYPETRITATRLSDAQVAVFKVWKKGGKGKLSELLAQVE